MPGGEVALDTNQAIAVLNATGETGTWVQGYNRVVLPIPVVGELLFGARNSGRPAENTARVERLVGRCEVLPATLDVARTYARIRDDLKRRGRPIPENDLWIAAICVDAGMPLATSDGHFREVEGLAVVLR